MEHLDSFVQLVIIVSLGLHLLLFAQLESIGTVSVHHYKLSAKIVLQSIYAHRPS